MIGLLGFVLFFCHDLQMCCQSRLKCCLVISNFGERKRPIYCHCRTVIQRYWMKIQLDWTRLAQNSVIWCIKHAIRCALYHSGRGSYQITFICWNCMFLMCSLPFLGFFYVWIYVSSVNVNMLIRNFKGHINNIVSIVEYFMFVFLKHTQDMILNIPLSVVFLSSMHRNLVAFFYT